MKKLLIMFFSDKVARRLLMVLFWSAFGTAAGFCSIVYFFKGDKLSAIYLMTCCIYFELGAYVGMWLNTVEL